MSKTKSEHSHRDLCRMTTRWLLKARWSYIGGYEIGTMEGQLDSLVISTPPDSALHQAALLCHEAWLVEWQRRTDKHNAATRVAERQGTPAPKTPPMPPKRFAIPKPAKKNVIAVAEVKRTRSDLLADLRRGKMLGYEPVGTRCYLAATAQALRLDSMAKAACSQALEELQALGLPKSWGVLVLPHESRRWASRVVSLRSARTLREAEDAEVRMHAYAIARSLGYRLTEHRTRSPTLGDLEDLEDQE